MHGTVAREYREAQLCVQPFRPGFTQFYGKGELKYDEPSQDKITIGILHVKESKFITVQMATDNSKKIDLFVNKLDRIMK